MYAIMTWGDYYNIKCPNCGISISYPIKSLNPVPFERKVYIIEGKCTKCKVKLEFEASWEIKLKAEVVKEDE